jgi:predicted permease
MTQVLAVIAPLFLVIAASAVLSRITRVGDEWSRVLNAFALHVGFPALVISALSDAGDHLREHTDLLLANSLFLLAVFAVALAAGAALRLTPRSGRTLFLCLGFGNVAYLGIPILVKVSGDAVLPAASLIVAVYLFWIFTLGVGRLELGNHRQHPGALNRTARGLVRNPLLLSVAAGLILAGTGIRLPDVVASALAMVAGAVTPVVLILIGLFLGNARPGKPAEWLPVLAFSAATLVLLPAGFYGGVLLLGGSPAAYSTSIIQAGMPLAITPFALAERYDLDREFIARSIVMSTALSLISLPFWISLF